MTTDVSSTAPTNADCDDTAKVEAHTNVLFRGFRMILEQYKTLQDAEVHTLLPDDIVDNLRHVLQCDAAKRKLVKGENGSAMEVDSGERRRGTWDYSRTAALLNRVVDKDVEGLKTLKSPVVLAQNATITTIIDKPPHLEQGTNFMRSQAVEYQEKLSLTGPFDKDIVDQPVYMGCKVDWFHLPKEIKLDFGKAEIHPGMKIELGDLVRCGVNRECIQAFEKRQMFYKVLELITVDIDRLSSFFSILVQEANAEIKKEEAGLKDRITPIIEDLDDICALQCNRAAALLYIMCQNTREAALANCTSLRGFNKNWLRLAHASKVLFVPGETDMQNILQKKGKAKMPPKRPAPSGGGYGRGGGKFPRGGGHMSDQAYGYSGSFNFGRM